MAETITAIYEKGVLRPLQPLNLREQQRVHIQIVSEQEIADEREATIRILEQAGLVRHQPRLSELPPDPVPAEERKALAERAGHVLGKKASEMVIEDRGEW
jgi:predicted DNA-binding antitoxin AbrB/MazE fold protein